MYGQPTLEASRRVESDRDKCLCMKVIGHIGRAFDPWDGTFWAVAQLLEGALSDIDIRRRTADQIISVQKCLTKRLIGMSNLYLLCILP